jgi:hypothetical protein
MAVIWFKCERCGHNTEAHLAVFSGLGPPRRRCGKCGKSYRNDRREWPELGPWRRAWFVAYSLAAAVAVGCLAGVMSAAAFGAGRELSGEVWLGRYWLAGMLMGVLWGGLVLLLQLFRLSCSVQRFEAQERVYDGPFWNLQVDVLLKVLGALFASVALVALLGLFSRVGG